MWTRRSLLVAVGGALLLWAGAAAPASAPQKAGQVRLTIVAATAERWDNGDILLRCRVVLDNQTGRDLTVESAFYSAFDGLEVVTSDRNGRRLVRQGYCYHQSVYSYPPQKFVLPKGKTERDMRFPVSGIALGLKEVRLQLEGTLPGSRYKEELTSNVVTVPVQ